MHVTLTVTHLQRFNHAPNQMLNLTQSNLRLTSARLFLYHLYVLSEIEWLILILNLNTALLYFHSCQPLEEGTFEFTQTVDLPQDGGWNPIIIPSIHHVKQSVPDRVELASRPALGLKKFTS